MARPKILIAEADKDLLDIYQIVIESEFDCELLIAQTGDKAIELLNNFDDIACIISDYKMPNRNGGDLFQANLKKKKLPFTLISGGFYSDFEKLEKFKPDGEKYIFLEKPITENGLIKAIRNMLSTTSFPQGDLHSDNYTRIKLKFLSEEITLPYDLYLKLSEGKYTKIINSEEEANEIINKYISKNEVFCYLKTSAFTEYIQVKLEQFAEEFSESAGQHETLRTSHKIINSLEMGLEVLGIRKEHIELVDKITDNCLNYLKKDKSLEKLLKNSFSNEGYLVSHSLLALHISYLISSRMKLNDEEILRKLAYASILHDLTLGSDELSQIMIISQDLLDELPLDKRLITRNHTKEMAALLENLEQIPSDTLKIISEHHEHPNGKGFPRNSGSRNISPLSGIFIISLKISDFILTRKIQGGDLSELVKELKCDYSNGKFKGPCNEFINYLSK